MSHLKTRCPFCSPRLMKSLPLPCSPSSWKWMCLVIRGRKCCVTKCCEPLTNCPAVIFRTKYYNSKHQAMQTDQYVISVTAQLKSELNNSWVKTETEKKNWKKNPHFKPLDSFSICEIQLQMSPTIQFEHFKFKTNEFRFNLCWH